MKLSGYAFVPVLMSMIACGSDSSSSSAEILEPEDAISSSSFSSSSQKVELSSSSVKKEVSSSSVVMESSSSAGICASVDFDEKKELCDEMDGQVYRIVTICNQTWLAQNYNYNSETSFAYDDDESNAEIYGRLYTYDDAVMFAPKGWRLPSNEDWRALFGCESVGGKLYDSEDGLETWIRLNKLKSEDYWNEVSKGSDYFGFGILPGGNKKPGAYHGLGGYAYFWSSTEVNDESAYDIMVRDDFYGIDGDDAVINTHEKVRGRSVRYVKNEK